MNKKGLTFFYLFMIGTVCFILGLALAYPLTQTSSESQEELDCSNSSISNQNKAVCYQMDSITPFFVATIFGLAGVILSRMVV
jgi:hypothetical protein